MPENCRAGSWEAWASHLHLRSDTSTVRLLPATSAGTLSGFSNLIHSGQSQTRDSLSQTCSFLIFPILVHGKLYVFHYLGWNSHPSFSHIPHPIHQKSYWLCFWMYPKSPLCSSFIAITLVQASVTFYSLLRELTVPTLASPQAVFHRTTTTGSPFSL